MHISMRGANNPNFKNAGRKICEVCEKTFHHYNKARRFCSMACRDQGEYAVRGTRKDNNHGEIVAALEKCGCSIIDLSKMGRGIPDLVAGFRGRWHVMEIKNPANAYGRKGFTPAQKKWADRQQAPVHIVRTVDEALRIIGLIP